MPETANTKREKEQKKTHTRKNGTMCLCMETVQCIVYIGEKSDKIKVHIKQKLAFISLVCHRSMYGTE